MNEALFRFINASVKCPLLDAVLPAFSDKDYVIIPGITVLAMVLYFGRRRARLFVLALLLALALSDVGSEKVLKPAFGAKRPYARIADVHFNRNGEWYVTSPELARIYNRKTHAFPSSHAANAAAFATVCLVFFGPASLAVSLPLAILIGLSRVYTGNHFPLDIAGGFVWGATCGLSVSLAVRRLLGRKDDASPSHIAEPVPAERKALYVLLACWTLINFAFIHLNWFELAGDEAQYWDWSRRLDLGYYSKPPLIAYVMEAFVSAGGNKEWAIRSPAVLLSSGSIALVYALTARIARSERPALVAALAMLCMPGTWLSAIVMTIDPLLIFFWALAMYAFHRAVRGEPAMWLLTGFAVGMGMLAKYTMLFLVVSFALYLVLIERSHLRRPGPYLAMLVALALNSGVVYWNWANEWVSIRHTANIGAPETPTVAARLGQVAEFFGGQMLVVSPILFGFMAWGLARLVPRFRRDRNAAFLFLCFGVLFFGYAAISLARRSHMNWPACAYLAAAPAFGLAWADGWRSRKAKRLFAAGLALGCLAGLAPRCTGLLYVADGVFRTADSPKDRICLGPWHVDPDKDPSNRLRGARELGAALGPYVRHKSDSGPFVFSDRYQVTALAAFYTRGRPRSYCMNPGNRRFNQYDMWNGWPELKGRDGLFVTGGSVLKANAFRQGMIDQGFFEDGEVLEAVNVYRGHVLIRNYTIVRMSAYTGKPWTPDEAKY